MKAVRGELILDYPQYCQPGKLYMVVMQEPDDFDWSGNHAKSQTITLWSHLSARMDAKELIRIPHEALVMYLGSAGVHAKLGYQDVFGWARMVGANFYTYLLVD